MLRRGPDTASKEASLCLPAFSSCRTQSTTLRLQARMVQT